MSHLHVVFFLASYDANLMDIILHYDIYVNISFLNELLWKRVSMDIWYDKNKPLAGNCKFLIPSYDSFHNLLHAREWGSPCKSYIFLISGYLCVSTTVFQLSALSSLAPETVFFFHFTSLYKHTYLYSHINEDLNLGKNIDITRVQSTVYLSHNHHMMKNNANSCATAVWQVWIP